LHKNQKIDLDAAVVEVMTAPFIGTRKSGDLSGLSVHKFKMVNQLTLLAYDYDEESDTLTLLALGSHENFSRDLKRSS
ncbi:MAG: type II toxin-antitoxin system RelE/ParE family toxin, partial [Patescibacteria group bacterium]